MNIWRLITHHEDSDHALTWSRQNERIAIGWGRIGDVSKEGYKSAREVGAAIRVMYPELNNYRQGGPSIWQFYADMVKGDLVILRAKSREAVMEVQGAYHFKEEETALTGNYCHQRRAVVSSVTSTEAWRMARANPASGQNIRWTLMLCGHAD